MRRMFALPALLLLAASAVGQPNRPEIVLPVAHAGMIRSAVFSPDGALVVTGSEDGSVVLWDAHSGQPLRRYTGHSFQVCSVGFAVGSSRIISASIGESVVIWDTATGATIRKIQDKLSAMASSRDGKRIFVAGHPSNDVTVFDGGSGERGRTLKGFDQGLENEIKCLAVSRDGSRLFAGSDSGEWLVWDTDSGKRLAERKPAEPSRYSAVAAAFRPEGKSLLVAHSSNHIQQFRWDFGDADARPVALAGAGAPITAFDPTGQYALAGHMSAFGARVLDLKTESNRKIEGVDRWSASCFSEDGKLALVGTYSEVGYTPARQIRAVICDTQTGKPTQTLRAVARAPWSLRLAGNQLTATDQEGNAVEWNLSTGTHRRTTVSMANWADRTVSTPDGRFTVKCAGGTGERATMTAKGGAAPRRTFGFDDDCIWEIAITADGKQVATVMGSRRLILWDAVSGKQIRTLQVANDGVETAAISPDGRRVATGMGSGRLVLWDAVSGEQIRSITAHGELVQKVVMTPDVKRLFSVAADGTTRIWAGDTGAELARLVSLNYGRDWFVYTSDGRFDGSPAALELVKVRTDGRLKLEPIGTAAKDRHRPGLLAAVLNAGRPGGK